MAEVSYSASIERERKEVNCLQNVTMTTSKSVSIMGQSFHESSVTKGCYNVKCLHLKYRHVLTQFISEHRLHNF